MSTHSLFGFRKKRARAAEKKSPAGNGLSTGAQQPFSDGSEEFFEEFTRREDGNRYRQQTGFWVGLGLALGLFLGAGTILFLQHNKAKPPKRKSWLLS